MKRLIPGLKADRGVGEPDDSSGSFESGLSERLHVPFQAVRSAVEAFPRPVLRTKNAIRLRPSRIRWLVPKKPA